MGFTSHRGPDFEFEPVTPAHGPLEAQLAALATRASAVGRTPVVYLTASWCPPSKQLEQSLGDPRMQRALSGLQLGVFDIDDWSDALTAGGFPVGVVPAFFLLDGAQKPTRKITGAAWGDNTAENMAPPLQAFFDAARPSAPPAPAPAAAALVPAKESLSKAAVVVVLLVAVAILRLMARIIAG